MLIMFLLSHANVSVDSLLGHGKWLAAELQYVSQYGGKRGGLRVKSCQRQISVYSLENQDTKDSGWLQCNRVTAIQKCNQIGLWVQSVVKWIFYRVGQLNLLIIWFITYFQIEKHREGRWFDPLTVSLEGPGYWPLFVSQQEEQVSVLLVVKQSRWGCGRAEGMVADSWTLVSAVFPRHHCSNLEWSGSELPVILLDHSGCGYVCFSCGLMWALKVIEIVINY